MNTHTHRHHAPFRVFPFRGLARLVFGLLALASANSRAMDYEVWLVDQSNSFGLTYGGYVHIWDGSRLEGKAASKAKPADILDLGAETAALCLANTGANPVRPHMLFFNSTHSHGVLAFVVSGHVVVFDGATREPVAAIRTLPGAGGSRQAHAAVPAPDDSGILVCNQNGKQLEWIDTDYSNNTYVRRDDKLLSLESLQTPDLPDNAPICAAIESSGRFGFVTLRGGGLAIVDVQATPMEVFALYDGAVIAPVGCGTQQIGDWMWVDAGGASPRISTALISTAFPWRALTVHSPIRLHPAKLSGSTLTLLWPRFCQRAK